MRDHFQRGVQRSCNWGRTRRPEKVRVGLRSQTRQTKKSRNQTQWLGVLTGYNQLTASQLCHTRLRGWKGYTQQKGERRGEMKGELRKLGVLTGCNQMTGSQL